MIDLLAWALRGARQQTLRLAAGIPARQSCAQAVPGEHHPVWTIGHLLLGDSYLLMLLGVAELPADFATLLNRYGPGAPPAADSTRYDPLDALVDRLAATGARRDDRIAAMTPAELAAPTPDPTLARSQPSLGHHLHGLVLHEGYHAGRLAAWRRGHQFPPIGWSLAPPTT